MARRLRRNPDGTPTTTNLNDILTEAASADAIRHLPGKGQPLDLHGYFHADPEQRVAGRLIRDNDILPQPLQDRRDAEIHREQVSALIEKTRLELSVRRFNIEQLGACLAPSEPQTDTPAYMKHGLVSVLPGARHAAAHELDHAVTEYASRRRQAHQRVREAAEKAYEAARGLNEQVMLSRHLPAGLQVIGVRVDTFLSQFDEAIPDLPALPASFVVAPSSGRVSGWRRLLHALSRRP